MPTIIQQQLEIEAPIIQAPMAGVQGSALAIAVSAAGGLGSLPCAMLSPAAIADELAAIHGATAKPFNVNFFCHRPPAPDPARETAWRRTLAPYYREFDIDPGGIGEGVRRDPFDADAVELLRAARPAVVSFHFGLPSAELVTAVKALGSKIWASATTVDEARWLEHQGADAIIAQGLEAGGHRGMFLSDELTRQVGSLALLPQVVAATRLPVIAAGGIASAAGVLAALALGAAAVQVGTAYLLSDEADTSAVHRAALETPEAAHTALTNRFSGRPARAIVNRLLRDLGPLGETPAFPLAAAALAPLRAAAEARGRGDFSPLWAGQNASACRAAPAAEITASLAAGI